MKEILPQILSDIKEMVMIMPAWRLVATYLFILLCLLIWRPEILKIIASWFQAA